MLVTKFQAINKSLQHKGKAQTSETVWYGTLTMGDWHKGSDESVFELPHDELRG